jgi:hypothetical protein
VTLSKREKYIAIGAGTLVGLWALYAVVGSAYLEPRTDLIAQQAAAKKRLADVDVLFYRQHSLEKIWNDMQQGGLKSDASAADSQAQHAMLYWFNASGVYLSALKSDPHIAQEGKFQVVKYHIQGEGHMRQVAQLLWDMETATIPVRVDELTVKPRGQEGTDDLTIEMGVSTLSSIPNTDKPGQPAIAAPDSEKEPL